MQNVEHSELIIGLIAPIGVDLEAIQKSTSDELSLLGYDCHTIKITDLMMGVECDVNVNNQSFSKSYETKMDYANKLRELYGNDILCRISIAKIKNIRAEITKEKNKDKNIDEQNITEVPKNVYLIRQLKHPDEVKFLRKIYGKNFILIAGNSPISIRKKNLKNLEKKSLNTRIEDADLESIVNLIINRDLQEEENEFGQKLEDAFPLSDVFIDSSNQKMLDSQIKRFFRALFGDNKISPTRQEHGMYIAKAASLASTDLSRQVGAAIFNKDGSILSMGCNEVPKATGGQYWEGDQEDGRDMQQGFDANESRKRELLSDLLDKMIDDGIVSEKYNKENISKEVDNLLSGSNKIKNSELMDIIEFGRSVHAEMSAISDASMKTLSIKNSILFCTTFPCHMCAKHIISSGISEVYFIEPYPKSFAEDLHSDAIEFNDNENNKKVKFLPFYGIAPNRYKDIFNKKRRKGRGGNARKWYFGEPIPMIERSFLVSYRLAEDLAVYEMNELNVKITNN